MIERSISYSMVDDDVDSKDEYDENDRRHSLVISQHGVLKDGLDTEDPEKAKPPRYTSAQWLTLITLAYGNFCLGACVSLQAPFYPKEAEKKGATPTEYGLIFGSYQLTIFILAPVFGKLVTYVTPKFMLNAGIFLVGATGIIFGVLDKAPNGVPFIALSFAVRIAEGVGAAAMRTSTYTIIAANFTGKMATTFSLLETFLGLGLITGPTLGGALYDAGGFGLPFFVVGALVLVDAFVIYFVLPEAQDGPILKPGNFLKFWLNPGIVVYSMLVFTCFFYIGFIQATLEPHLRPYNLSGALLGTMFVIQGGTYALTAPLWGFLCDKGIDNKILAIGGCCVTTLFWLIVGPVSFIRLETKLGLIIAGLILMGLGLGVKLVSTFIGSLKDTIGRGFPSDLTTYGLISSMFASSQSLGAFVGPSVGGYLLETVGFRTGSIVCFGLEVFQVILTVTYSSAVWIKMKKDSDPEKAPLLKDKISPKK